MSDNVRVKFSALTPVTNQAQVVPAINALIANLTPLVGQHKNKNERAVQWSDLLSLGLANVKGLAEDGYPDYGLPPPEKPDMSTPPAIANFKVEASFNFVTMSWDQPRYKNHAFVEVWRAPGFKKLPDGSEVPSVRSDAVFRLMTASIVCSDTVLPGDKWRYWARNVSSNGVLGEWTSIDGHLAEVPEDPAYLIDKISGEIREGDLYPALGAKIDTAYDGFFTNSDAITSQGQTLAYHTQTLASHGAAIQQQAAINTNQGALINAAWTVRIDSGNAVSGFGLMVDGATGRSDFIIRSDRFAIAAPQAYDQNGKPVVDTAAFPFIVDVTNPASPKVLIKNAYIDQAFIQTLVTGSLVADRITGQTLTGTHIRGGDMAIGSNFSVDSAGSATMLNAFIKGTIQSSNYGAGVSGWQIHNNGNAEFNNGVFRGTVYAEDGYFNGTVRADKILGDVVTAKTVSVAARTATGNTTIASASVVGNRQKSATLMVQGLSIIAVAVGGRTSGGNDQDTNARITGNLEVLNTAGTVIASVPFEVSGSGSGNLGRKFLPVFVSAGFPAGTSAATITVRVASVVIDAGGGGSYAQIDIPAQSVVFMLVPQGSQFS